MGQKVEVGTLGLQYAQDQAYRKLLAAEQEVVAWRAQERELRAAYDAKFRALLKEMQPQAEKWDCAKDRVAEAEDCLRQCGEEYYELSGDKRPTEGVKIRIVRNLEYDEAAAIEHATQHAPKLLALRVGDFNRYARALDKAGQGLDFVKIAQVVQVMLTKALDGPAPEGGE